VILLITCVSVYRSQSLLQCSVVGLAGMLFGRCGSVDIYGCAVVQCTMYRLHPLLLLHFRDLVLTSSCGRSVDPVLCRCCRMPHSIVQPSSAHVHVASRHYLVNPCRTPVCPAYTFCTSVVPLTLSDCLATDACRSSFVCERFQPYIAIHMIRLLTLLSFGSPCVS
jgi:hypothetical protein